jgi:hypothetical protein
MAEIQRVLPSIEIEDGKLLPTYFEELQKVLLSQNINEYNQFEFEDRLYDSNEILFFPPISNNVKLASKNKSGYAIFINRFHYHIIWYVALSNDYISERIGMNGEGMSFAFLFEWENERQISIYRKKIRRSK